MSKNPTRITRTPERRWVLVADLQTHPSAQRPLDTVRVTKMKTEFNPDLLGLPVINRMPDGTLYTVDGQHRVAMLRAIGWGDQQVECEVYDGLTVPQMARLFLDLQSNRVRVKTIDEFLVAVTSEDETAVGVNRIVRGAGLVVDRHQRDGAVQAVAAMVRIYNGAGLGPKAQKDGPAALGRTLTTLKDAWGDAPSSFGGAIIEGVGQMQLRYNGTIEQPALAKKLATESGGAAGVLSRAKSMRDTMGGTLSRSVAGVAVEVYNRGRRTGKLDSWWK